MPQSKTVNIVSMHVDFPEGIKRVRVRVKRSDYHIFETVDVPIQYTITKKMILDYVCLMLDNYKLEKVSKWLMQ